MPLLSSSASGATLIGRVSHVTETVDGSKVYFDLYDADSLWFALIVPGFWRDRSHPTMLQLGTELAELGYRAAVIDVRGHGESSGLYEFNLRECNDVLAVARKLMEMSEVKGIVLIGLSVGGAIAISAVAEAPELPWIGLLLISSVATFGMIRPWLNPFTMNRHLSLSQAIRKPRFTWRFLFSRKRSALEDIGRVRQPVCFIHMRRDWLIHHRHSIALYEAAHEPKELHLIDRPGRYHADRLFMVAPEIIGPIMRRFLQKIRPEFASTENRSM